MNKQSEGILRGYPKKKAHLTLRVGQTVTSGRVHRIFVFFDKNQLCSNAILRCLCHQDNKEIKIGVTTGDTFEVADLAFEVKKVSGVQIKLFDSEGNMDVFTWPVCQVLI